MASVDELKALGNKAIAEKKFDEAIDAFTKAISIDPNNHILYSNRSAAYASKKDWTNALKDAEKTTEIKPDWPRGQELFSDPRMIQVLGVLMGIDMQMGGSDDIPGAAAAGASSGAKEVEEDVEMPDANAADSKSQSKSEPAKAPEPEPELDEEEIAKRKAKEEADKEKALGTENYKKRNFDEAIKHYTKAWELYKDITYLNNLGAAHFEKGDYQACIDACTQAIEEGRKIYADFKMIAKSYARIGTAYEKQGDLAAAIENYQKSLTEHRTPDTVNKLRAAERRKIEEAKKAYIDPEKAEEAREEGNKKFKEQDFPGAVAAYSEMIKRSPDDPRGYSNRAAAFVKLFEFPSALEDCNTAIKKDPKFIRAYIRKAQIYFGMREYSKCIDACNEATTVDSEHHNNANAREIEQQQQKALQAMYAARENETEEQTRERLLKDPEIMSIMQDPVMQSILQQAQSDPAALQEHMRNPSVRSNIQKLIAAGVIRVGR
ncbi:hypothetical protein K445DRAFT_192208 [Daldinia sp. EC12]|nr:hypothetical protein K445DRAFT_192208 [Daldinia sp. EC12]